MVDGLAHRVDRLKALGNGQVPLVAAVAWTVLMNMLPPGGLRPEQERLFN